MTRIQILLSMRDVRDYLADQIDSLIWQELKPWRYLMRDAGSRDDSVAIARRYDLRIVPEVIEAEEAAPNAAAFEILKAADPAADLYALCGGDDIWHEPKLRLAAETMQARGGQGDGPVLYCARARIVHAEGELAGLSPDYPERLSLLRLLFEPAVIGQTVVMNGAARDLLACSEMKDAPFWPWSMALAVAACGGRVVYDRRPVMDLRLHPGKWLAVSSGIPDPATSHHYDMRLPFSLLSKHLRALRTLPSLSAQAEATLASVDAALKDKAARRALADHPDLDGGPYLRTLKLKRAIARGLAG